MGQRTTLKRREQQCQQLLLKGKRNQKACLSLLDTVLDASTINGQKKALMYDARQFVQSNEAFPPQHQRVEAYMNRPDVKRALHATSCPHSFKECTDPPFNALVHLEGKGIRKQFEVLLDAGVSVLVFAGVHDVICNHIGIEKALRALSWKGTEAFAQSSASVWTVNKAPVGYSTAGMNLMYLRVLNAGHMVPLDQPAFALEMMRWFLSKDNKGAQAQGTIVMRDSVLEVSRSEATEDASPAQAIQEVVESSPAIELSPTHFNMTSCCATQASIRGVDTCSVQLEMRVHPAEADHLDRLSHTFLNELLLVDLKVALGIGEQRQGRLIALSRGPQFKFKFTGSQSTVLEVLTDIASQSNNETSLLRHQGILSRHIVAIELKCLAEVTYSFGQTVGNGNAVIISIAILFMIGLLLYALLKLKTSSWGAAIIRIDKDEEKLT